MWLAPDGTLFTAGYMITGKPGPDTGAVHRLAPGGKLERVFESPERELYDVWGRTSSDVYAVGPKIVVHWDGATWTEIPITGITDTINHVTGTANDVWITAVHNHPEESTIYRLDGNTWKADHHVPCLLRGLVVGTTKLFAAGACDTVFVRDAGGTWNNEQLPRGGAYEITAVSDADVYVAVDELLHRGPNGKWSAVKTDFARVYTVEPAHGDQVFVIGNLVRAGGESGIELGARGRWTRLDLKDCQHAAAIGSTIYCIRERHVSAEPPEDLRKP